MINCIMSNRKDHVESLHDAMHALMIRTGRKFGEMKLVGWGNSQEIQLCP